MNPSNLLLEARLLHRIRLCLSVFIDGLLLSGITAFPLESETAFLVGMLEHSRIGSQSALSTWIGSVHDALRITNGQFPFLAYGTDWLAFAHIVIAAAFIGPWRHPIRNKWVSHIWVHRPCVGRTTCPYCRRSPWHSSLLAIRRLQLWHFRHHSLARVPAICRTTGVAYASQPHDSFATTK